MWEFYKYPQDQVVYLWEDKTVHCWFRHHSDLTLQECKDFVKEISEKFDIATPIVKDGRGCKCATATDNVIQMPRYSRCKIVVLHEMAHVIQYAIRGISNHEEEFVDIYVCLLEIYMPCSRFELERGMDQYKVRYSKHPRPTYQDITKLIKESKHQAALPV